MNIVQVIFALTLFIISTVAASSALIIDSPLDGSVQYIGTPFNLNVVFPDAQTTILYNAVFTSADGTAVKTLNGETPGNNVAVTFNTADGAVGPISLTVSPASGNYAPTTIIFILYSKLSITSPSAVAPSVPQITYGDSVDLTVTSNSPSSVTYTASFTCPTGIFQITGLTAGTAYSIVPAGIYGTVVITVTAENNTPATLSMLINKPTANIPPAFVPGRIPYYPSVYANMKEDGNLEIISVEYLKSSPM